jgi:PmbA protein
VATTRGSAGCDMQEIGHACVANALARGATEVAARVYRVRDVTVQWRDGKLEQIQEATTRGVGLQLYVEGRYSAVTSSDLRLEALDGFIADSVGLTRSLAKDPFRSLPDPALYEGQPAVDLELEDPTYGGLAPEGRRRVARELEEAARAAEGAGAIVSVTTGVSDSRAEAFRVHSDGFEGSRVETRFWLSAQVSVRDRDGRRPEDYAIAGAHHLADLPPIAEVGGQAALRAISRLGSKKGESAALAVVVENRAAGRLFAALATALSAGALQQKRSFLEAKLGTRVGSDLLHVVDDPLVVRGLGSRLFDNEGIAAKPLVVFDGGVLGSFFVDTYYGKKLGVPPTTGSPSNVTWRLGGKDRTGLIRDAKEGILVTDFLGGNANSATGDFSFGVQGFRIRNGATAEPIAEMNVSGNQLELWKKLVAVGNDPYPYSTMLTPTLSFEGVQVAGV